MSDQQWQQPIEPHAEAGAPPPPPPGAGLSPYGSTAPVAYPQAGPIGKVRSTGVCMLLYFVTLGFYGLYWYYATHAEMKRHSGRGIGGGVALLLAIFIGIVMPYINSAEVGDLHAAAGREKPVSAATGLWYFPGIFIIVGPIVWFVKSNGALNDYWRSRGAVG
jgi:hypothetical protein